MKRRETERAWPFAEGGGSTIFIVTLLWAAAVYLWFAYPGAAAGGGLFLATTLWLLVLYFFRDPRRDGRREPGLVLAPADGEVVEISHEQETDYLRTEVIRISLFLSIADVHVQRIPVDGRVALVERRAGKFLQAFKPEASRVNESIAMVIETAYGDILVRQIAGILARRCVNYARPGQEVAAGDRFGLIRFGSRVDLFLPPEAGLCIRLGERVAGGLTPVARLGQAD